VAAVGAFVSFRTLEAIVKASRDRDGQADRDARKEILDRLEAARTEASKADAARRAREEEAAAARSDLERMRREGEERDRRSAVLEQEVLALRRQAASLEERLKAAEAARAGAGAPGEGAGPGKGPEGPAEEAGKAAPAEGRGPGVDVPEAPALGPSAVTDPGQVRKVVDGLNDLLRGVGGRETWRIAAAGALDGDRLVRVRVETRTSDGGIPKAFQAEEARFVLLPSSKCLEIRLKEGSVTYMGSRTVPFPDGKYTAVLAVDPAPFQASGNPLLGQR
jgi:hypothetical protein